MDLLGINITGKYRKTISSNRKKAGSVRNNVLEKIKSKFFLFFLKTSLFK